MAPRSMPPPAAPSRIRALSLRLGAFGWLMVGVSIALGWFALFGCSTISPGQKRDVEGMTVNPPDAYMKRWAK